MIFPCNHPPHLLAETVAVIQGDRVVGIRRPREAKGGALQ